MLSCNNCKSFHGNSWVLSICLCCFHRLFWPFLELNAYILGSSTLVAIWDWIQPPCFRVTKLIFLIERTSITVILNIFLEKTIFLSILWIVELPSLHMFIPSSWEQYEIAVAVSGHCQWTKDQANFIFLTAAFTVSIFRKIAVMEGTAVAGEGWFWEAVC